MDIGSKTAGVRHKISKPVVRAAAKVALRLYGKRRQGFERQFGVSNIIAIKAGCCFGRIAGR